MGNAARSAPIAVYAFRAADSEPTIPHYRIDRRALIA